MEEYTINGKAIYTPKGAALEYGRVGCNFYTGCPHDCEYCYLKRGAPSKQLGGKEVKLKKCFKDKADAFDVFCKEARAHIDYLRKTGIFFSFTTDPLINETMELTISAMKFCVHTQIPVKVLTKNADFIHNENMDALLGSDEAKKYISFGFTLTGHDEMEPAASANIERIEAMQYLHDMGFKTFASIEPVIDWAAASEVVSASLECCDHYKIGLRSGVKGNYYDVYASSIAVHDIVNDIIFMKRTVYLKESVRKLLSKTHSERDLNDFLKDTLDMDGKPFICS